MAKPTVAACLAEIAALTARLEALDSRLAALESRPVSPPAASTRSWSKREPVSDGLPVLGRIQQAVQCETHGPVSANAQGKCPTCFLLATQLRYLGAPAPEQRRTRPS